MLHKPYRYKGCIIYSNKNKTFLELFAQVLETRQQKEKIAMHGRKEKVGGITYNVLVNDKKKVMLVSEGKRGTQPKSATVWLKEE
jgi:hypothetical protein